MADLLSIIVRRWKTEFKGISASEVAGVLSISHNEALSQLQALAAKGLIVVKEYQHSEPTKFHDAKVGNAIIRTVEESEDVDSLMAFPSAAVLTEVFYNERVDYGVFTNRMHKGASQVQHFYFKRDILEHYVKRRDRYTVEEDKTGGSVSMTTEYYLSIPEADRDELGFATIRLGKMKLEDGTEAVGAIAKDLADLPKQEQHHWAAHEIENPVLSQDDQAWSDYISEQFQGNWDAAHTDYIRGLTEVLLEINKGGQMFRRTAHPGLHVPVLNTFGEYIAAHKELYKLIGVDNLVQDTLKAALRTCGSEDKDFRHDGGRPKGAWALMKMLAGRKGLDWTPFEVVDDHRQEDAHRIQEKAPRGEYYPSKFQDDLSKLVPELRKLV